jgi:serine/threonine protein kinase
MIQPDRAIRIAVQIASGLEAAWKLGIVHRDVKPANILLTKTDMAAKLADLGLAMVSMGTATDGVTEATAGGFAGTVAYMAPEQAQGDSRAIDHRADMYALGCSLYHMLSGELPFSGRSRMELLMKHASEKPIPLTEKVHGISLQLSELVDRLLAKSPADRFNTYAELLQAFNEFNLAGISMTQTATGTGSSTGLSPSGHGGAKSSKGRSKDSIWQRMFGALGLSRGSKEDPQTNS